jgi:DNA-binding NarL/FixJ family response regulator
VPKDVGAGFAAQYRFHDRRRAAAPLLFLQRVRLARVILPKPRALSPDKRGSLFLPKEKQPEAALLEALTPREREVLLRVVEGLASKEIARLLGVRPSTVDTYRSRIMAKLGVEDLPSLVRFAVRHGLIKP